MRINPINYQTYRSKNTINKSAVSFASAMTSQDALRAYSQDAFCRAERSDFTWRPDYSFHHPDPKKYKKTDDFLSRSAALDSENIVWLKNQGVTDILDLTIPYSYDDYSEENEAEKSGIKYHNIPINTKMLDTKVIDEIMALIDEIKKENGKLHIHCNEGVDRTGMITFIYKTVNNIATPEENIKEWHNMGHDFKMHCSMVPFAIRYCQNYKN